MPRHTTRIYPVAIATTVLFFVLVTLLTIFGFIPELTEASSKFNISGQAVDRLVTARDVPRRIVIPTLDIDSVIINQKNSDIQSLDNALLKGIVRYPGSASLGSHGTMLLFGHSSHLPVIHNKNYKIFNEINTLKKNDEIVIYGDTDIYRYKVTKVSMSKNSEAKIDLQSTTAKLILVTCNNFGGKEDRYIVEARLVK